MRFAVEYFIWHLRTYGKTKIKVSDLVQSKLEMVQNVVVVI